MLLVLTSFPDAEAAASVVRSLVEERLIACGTILPSARSIYAWKGGIEDNTEALVILKTEEALYARLEKRLARLHPYEVPEIIAWEPGAVSRPYAAWIADAVSSP